MTLKKFILKFAVLAGISFVCCNFIIGFFLHFYPNYFLGSYSDYYLIQATYQNITTHREKQNIILGDSRGNASIIPKELSPNFINLSIPGSNFFEGYLTLKKRIAFAPVDTLICVYGIGFYEENSWTNRRTIPYRFASEQEMRKLCKVEFSKNQIINNLGTSGKLSLLHQQVVRQFKYWHFPFSYASNFSDSYADFQQNRQPIYKEKNLFANLGYIEFGSKDSINTISSLNETRTFKANLSNLSYLDSIEEICKAQNICLLIVLPPINAASYMHYAQSRYLVSAQNFLNQHFEKRLLLGINYLPNTCFGDDTHLNTLGAKLFTKKIRGLIHDSSLDSN